MLQIILYENYKQEFPSDKDSSEINLQVGRKLIDFKAMPSFVEYVRNVLNKFNLNNEKVNFKKKFIFNNFLLNSKN